MRKMEELQDINQLPFEVAVVEELRDIFNRVARKQLAPEAAREVVKSLGNLIVKTFVDGSLDTGRQLPNLARIWDNINQMLELDGSEVAAFVNDKRVGFRPRLGSNLHSTELAN